MFTGLSKFFMTGYQKLKLQVAEVDGKLTPMAVPREIAADIEVELAHLDYAQERYILPAYRTAQDAKATDEVIAPLVQLFIDTEHRMAERELLFFAVPGELADLSRELTAIYRRIMTIQREAKIEHLKFTEESMVSAAHDEVIGAAMVTSKVEHRQRMDRTFRLAAFRDAEVQTTKFATDDQLKRMRDDGQIAERFRRKYQKTLAPAMPQAELIAAARAEMDRRLAPEVE